MGHPLIGLLPAVSPPLQFFIHCCKVTFLKWKHELIMNVAQNGRFLLLPRLLFIILLAGSIVHPSASYMQSSDLQSLVVSPSQPHLCSRLLLLLFPSLSSSPSPFSPALSSHPLWVLPSPLPLCPSPSSLDLQCGFPRRFTSRCVRGLASVLL